VADRKPLRKTTSGKTDDPLAVQPAQDACEDPEVARIVAAWSSLPEPTRRAIITIIDGKWILNEARILGTYEIEPARDRPVAYKLTGSDSSYILVRRLRARRSTGRFDRRQTRSVPFPGHKQRLPGSVALWQAVAATPVPFHETLPLRHHVTSRWP
jgi:hypothetical protein